MNVQFTIIGRTADEVLLAARRRLQEFADGRDFSTKNINAQPKVETWQGDVIIWEAKVEAHII